jgi:AraC-like DNA-binding protein
MPIFMDLHIAPGTTPKEVAQGHALDVANQDRYGCRAMTYWFDMEGGTGFCLFDAPDKESVIQLHKNTHGLVPNEIIPVNSQVVEAFLGRIKDPEGYFEPENPKLRVFNDPAFRIIMVTETMDERLLIQKLGKQKANELLKIHHSIIREQISKYEGREAELDEAGFVISFVSVIQAVECGKSILKSLHVAADLLEFRIGLHAGLPVSQSNRIFGKTISFAGFLCKIANTNTNKIILSSLIRNLYKTKSTEQLIDNERIKWLSPAEEKFLGILLETLEKHWNNSELSIFEFCTEISMSKPQLYRKCKLSTGMSPNELLREYRLQKSLTLLKNDNQNISQVAYETGFNSPSYFTKCFQKRFGIQPLHYFKEFK